MGNITIIPYGQSLYKIYMETNYTLGYIRKQNIGTFGTNKEPIPADQIPPTFEIFARIDGTTEATVVSIQSGYDLHYYYTGNGDSLGIIPLYPKTIRFEADGRANPSYDIAPVNRVTGKRVETK